MVHLAITRFHHSPTFTSKMVAEILNKNKYRIPKPEKVITNDELKNPNYNGKFSNLVCPLKAHRPAIRPFQPENHFGKMKTPQTS